METACDAALGYRRPARFACVCPLLKRNPAGELRCSADTRHVRPFWGRAALAAALLFAGLYVAGTTAFFLAQRALRKPLSYRQAVWPPAWKEYRLVQSRYFAAKAERALAEKNVGEAVISLSLAYQLDARNFSAGYALAQLWQFSQPAMADRVYAKLADEHPERRGAALAAWYQSLLLRGDFGSILSLAAAALKSDPVQADAWMHALVSAARREPRAAAVQQLASDATLPEEARLLFILDQRTLGQAPESSRDELVRGPRGTKSAFFDYYRPRRLIELGFGREALAVLQEPGSRLTDRDKTVLWLDARGTAGWDASSRAQVTRLLESPQAAAAFELVCATLVRNPDPALLQITADRAFRAAPLPAGADFRSAIAVACAAGAQGDDVLLRAAIGRAKQAAAGRFQALDLFETFLRGRQLSSRIETFLPALQPMSSELVHALLERYHKPVGPAQAPSPALP